MRKTVWIRVFFILFFLLVISSEKTFAVDSALGGEQGYVLVSSSFEDVRFLIFSKYRSKGKFTVNRDARLIKVPAGKYHYKSAVSIFQNVTFYAFDEPDTDLHTFEVRAGAVTYIGNWVLARKDIRNDIDWDLTVEFPPEPMLRAKRDFPWVKSYPLYVAKTGSPPLELSWD